MSWQKVKVLTSKQKETKESRFNHSRQPGVGGRKSDEETYGYNLKLENINIFQDICVGPLISSGALSQKG